MKPRHFIMSAALISLLAVAPTWAGEPTKPTPAGNPGDWVTVNDYPDDMIRQEKAGVVGFQLSIGADGAPTACAIISSSGAPDLDQQTCKLLLGRARFHPALDANGRATTGTFVNRIRWVLPEGVIKPAPVSYSYDVSFIVGADGRTSDCVFSNVQGIPPEGIASMTRMCGADRYEPALDANGAPVARRVRSHREFKVEPVQ